MIKLCTLSFTDMVKDIQQYKVVVYRIKKIRFWEITTTYRVIMPPYIAPELKQRIGVWGPPTSTLDWCERNYISTLFIAELCKYR